MLDAAAIAGIAWEVAASHLPPKSVERVQADAEVASDGEEAVFILIVLNSGSLQNISGNVTLETSVDLQDRLMKAGESRFAYIDYATEDDLAAANDD